MLTHPAIRAAAAEAKAFARRRMLRLKTLAALAAVALVAGCSATGSVQPLAVTGNLQADLATDANGLNAGLAKVATFSIADANAAEVLAVAHKDPYSIPCYPAIVTFINTYQPLGAPNLTLVGALTLHQQARDLVMGVSGTSAVSPLVPLKVACAAMVQDDTAFVVNLAALAGVTVAGGPVAGAGIGAINATIGAVLPK